MTLFRLLHVALGVTDLQRSVAFYRDVLGFSVVADAMSVGAMGARSLGIASDGLEVALLERDGSRLELVRAIGPPAMTPGAHGALSHVAFAVDDLATTLGALRGRGVEVVASSHATHAPGVESCVIRDPDGFPILLHQAPSGVASPWAER